MRLRDIDAPELRAHCEAEREMADAMRRELATLVGRDVVRLTRIEGDRYFGRVLADVATAGDADAASALLDRGSRPPL